MSGHVHTGVVRIGWCQFGRCPIEFFAELPADFAGRVDPAAYRDALRGAAEEGWANPEHFPEAWPYHYTICPVHAVLGSM